MDVTRDLVAELIEEEIALQTLKRIELDEVWRLVSERAPFETEEELFEALMAVMYETRPQGVL